MNKKNNKKPQKKPQKALQSGRRENAPAAKSRRLTEIRPQESIRSNGTRQIHFKEFVQDIPGSTGFSVTQFQCNPGLDNLFAWLSGQAAFYQEYTVKSLKFSYETQKATTLSGKVMFAFLQDSADALATSKQEMLENLMKAAGAVWEPFHLPITMSNFPALGKSRFVRSGSLPPNLDVKTYDIGQLQVATQGMADTSLVGELYVEYTIELRTPVLQFSALLASKSIKFLGVAPSQTSFLGAAPTEVGGLNVDASGNTITFRTTGQFILAGGIVGTGLHTSYLPVMTGTATTKFVQQGLSNAAADAGTNAMFTILVNVTSRDQTVIIDHSTMATTITASDLRIAPYAIANS